MKTAWKAAGLLLAALEFGAGSGTRARGTPGSAAIAPYAVEGPLAEPRMFGRGVLSTDGDEFGATLTPDGGTVFFSMSVGHHSQYMICVSKFLNGKWATPVMAPFSGKYWDFDACVSPDGERVFFASDRPRHGKPDGDGDFNIWYVEKEGNGWSEPRDPGDEVNSDADESFASATRDGTLYFTSDRGHRETSEHHFYRSKLVDGHYGPAELLAGPLNDAVNTSLEITVSPDETFALITSFSRPDGLGLGDLYVSRNNDGVWSDPVSLGPKVNTRARDYSARFSPDGRYLFFTSERGFATDPPDRPFSWEQLQRGFRSIENGFGNIYQIDLSAVGLRIAER